MPTVTLDKVSVSFGTRRVLDAVSGIIEGPGVVAIVGPSGSGKTTLLHVIAGLVIPDVGSSTLSGAGGVPPAWVVQNSPLLAHRTAQENVALGALVRGKSWDHAQTLAEPIMTMLGVAPLATTPAYRLSGGERQRVAVGRAIASSAPLVLADEPTASLDEDARSLVVKALHDAANAGALVIVTTHDPVVSASAHQAYALRRGQLAIEALEARHG